MARSRATASGRETLVAAAFVAPLLLALAALAALPVLGTVAESFFSDTGFAARKAVGFANYSALLADRGFWQSLRFTAFFVAASVPLEVALGVAFALVLNAETPARSALRACVLIPWAIPTAISSRVWELVYNYQYGLANYLITASGLSAAPVNWLGTGPGAFCALVLAEVWKTTPFVAIIVLAGLQGIPQDIYAQAKIDRAGFVQVFLRLTLPLALPAILVALLFRTIDAVRVFDVIYVLTHGGPGGATSSLSLYAYKYFLNGDFGYGSAISTVLFAMAMALSLVYIRAAGVGRNEA